MELNQTSLKPVTYSTHIRNPMPIEKWGPWIPAGALTAATLVLYATSALPMATKLLGLAIIWVSLIPGLLYFSRHETSSIPFMPLVGLFYAVFFGLPIFILPLSTKPGEPVTNYGTELLSVIDNQILSIVLAAILLMNLCYVAGARGLFTRMPRLPVARGADLNILTYVFWALFLGHLIYRLVPEIRQLPSVGQILEPAGYVGMCGLFLHWRRKRLPPVQTFAFFVIFLPLEVYLRLRLLFLTDLLIFSVFVCLVLWRERQYKIIGGIFVFVLFVFTFFGASTTVRTAYKDPMDRISMALKVYKAIVLHGEDIVYAENGSRSFGREGRFGSLARRTGHIWIFHYVYDQTPEIVPYWGGETYRPLLTAMIPRIILPDKPLEKTGGKFGYRYGFTKDPNDATSINLPWITEFYANFGVLGLMAGMALVGLALSFVEKIFIGRRPTDVEFAFGLAIVLPLVYPESNMSVMVGSLPLVALSFWSLFWLIAIGKTKMGMSHKNAR